MGLRRAPIPVQDDRDRALADALSRYVREVDERLLLSYGQPTEFIRSSYRARLGELIRADPTDASIAIDLPIFSNEDIGKAITITNVSSSSNSITIRALNGRVNGLSSVAIAAGYAVRQAVAADPRNQLWLLTTVLDGAVTASNDPLWEWNGTDLSQFGSMTKGSGVTSCSAAVVTAYGSNWIEITHTENNSVGFDPANKMSLLPILASSIGASDYRIEAECYISAAGTSGGIPRWGLGVRMDPAGGSTTPGTGYVAIHRPNTTPDGRTLARFTATAATSLRSEASTGVAVHTETSTAHKDTLSLSVVGGSLTADITGLRIGAVDSNITGELQAGILAGCNAGSFGTATVKISFRAIRIWAAS